MRAHLPVLAALLIAPLVVTMPAHAAAPATPSASVQPRVGSVSIDGPQLWAMQDDTTYWQGYTITLNGNYSFPDDSVFTRPIGTAATPFTSTFDGNSKSISNLRVNVTGGSSTVLAGLFGRLGVGGEVKNLTVIDDSITGVSTGVNPVYAGLVATSLGTVTNVKVSGEVSVQGASGIVAYAGGLVGTGVDDTVSQAFVEGHVSGVGPSVTVGGVVGSGQGTRISRVASQSTVSASSTLTTRAGGIAGQFFNAAGQPATVTDSYAQGDVNATGSGTALLGGIVGQSPSASAVLTRTYYSATVSQSNVPSASLGGLGGEMTGDTISQSYYANTNATDVGSASGTTRDDTALSLVALQQMASYSTWPIVGTWQSPGANTWGICEGQSTPYLLWQASANPCVGAVSVSGTAEVGQTLTASVTAADDSVLKWGYLDSGVFTGLPETNYPTYVVTSYDIGHRMAVRVTSRSGTATAIAYSAPTSVVPALPPPPPPPVFPPGAPTGVTATAGDASASVNWTAPADTGSFPITTYQVTASPGGATCTSATLTCEVTGITNGTAYTFTARALNGAGWGPWSSPSAAVTPTAPPTPTITITGKGEPRRVYVSGTSTDLAAGTALTVWVRMGGRGEFAATPRPVVVAADGSFAWERKRGRGREVQVYFTSDPVASNTLTFRGR